ncbi:MAG: sulfatase [Rhodopirellula sp.]|nr:sulfatase [Rhodopirellula sp.]
MTMDAQTRRNFLNRTSMGLGALATASIAQDSDLLARGRQTKPGTGLHFPAKAKRVIYLHMSGGPSHLDTFDNKPQMQKHHGEPLPQSVIGKQRLTTMTREQAKLLVAATQQDWGKYGESGIEMNAEFKEISTIADEMCLIKSIHSTPINHDPAVTFLQTGSPLSGRPCLGSWLSYGLGSENKDLPEFVVLLSNGGQPVPSRYWHNGFLPSRHQGVQFQSKGDPVLYLSNPEGIDDTNRKNLVGGINSLNQLKQKQIGDPEIEARINAYELAYRMQSSVPELMDISRESKETLEAYGANPGGSGFANNCLLARRLAEAGVRFIQLYDRGWDHHSDVTSNIKNKIKQVDKPCAALVKDLKQRGLLEDTLVIWGGEFGRTSYGQDRGKTYGRDHHPNCFSLWLAGGGIQGGVSIGETDDFGYNVATDQVEIHDLHATMLHLLGIDHEQLTYKFKGRDFRLTDVAGNVVQAALA